MNELNNFKPDVVNQDSKYQLEAIIDFGGCSKEGRELISKFVLPTQDLCRNLKLNNEEWVYFWYEADNDGQKKQLLSDACEGNGISDLKLCIDKVIEYMTVPRNSSQLISHSDIKNHIEHVSKTKRMSSSSEYDINAMLFLWKIEPFSFGVTDIAALFQHPLFPNELKAKETSYECFSEGFKKIEVLIKSGKYNELFLKYLIQSIRIHCLTNIRKLKLPNVLGQLSRMNPTMVSTAFANIKNFQQNFRLVLDSIGVSLFQQKTHPNYFWFLSGIGYSDPGTHPELMVNYFKVNALIMKLSIACENYNYGVYVMIRLRMFILSQKKSQTIFCFDDYVEFITAFSDFVNYCSKNSNALLIISNWYSNAMLEMVNMRELDVVLGIRRQKYVFSPINDVFQQSHVLSVLSTNLPDNFFTTTQIPIFTPTHLHYNFFFDAFSELVPYVICNKALFNPVEFMCVMNEILQNNDNVGLKRRHEVKISSFFRVIDYELNKKDYGLSSKNVKINDVPTPKQTRKDFNQFLKSPFDIPDFAQFQDYGFDFYFLWNKIFDDQRTLGDVLFSLSKYDVTFNPASSSDLTNVLCVEGKNLEFETAVFDYREIIVDYSSVDDFTGIFENIAQNSLKMIKSNLQNEFWEFVQIFEQGEDQFAELLLLLKQSDKKTFERITSQFCMKKLEVLCYQPLKKYYKFDEVIKKKIDPCEIKRVEDDGEVMVRDIYSCFNESKGELRFFHSMEYN